MNRRQMKISQDLGAVFDAAKEGFTIRFEYADEGWTLRRGEWGYVLWQGGEELDKVDPETDKAVVCKGPSIRVCLDNQLNIENISAGRDKLLQQAIHDLIDKAIDSYGS